MSKYGHSYNCGCSKLIDWSASEYLQEHANGQSCQKRIKESWQGKQWVLCWLDWNNCFSITVQCPFSIFQTQLWHILAREEKDWTLSFLSPLGHIALSFLFHIFPWLYFLYWYCWYSSMEILIHFSASLYIICAKTCPNETPFHLYTLQIDLCVTCTLVFFVLNVPRLCWWYFGRTSKHWKRGKNILKIKISSPKFTMCHQWFRRQDPCAMNTTGRHATVG